MRLVFIYEFKHLDGGMSHSMIDMINALRSCYEIVVLAPHSACLDSRFSSMGITYVYDDTADWAVSFKTPFKSAWNCIKIQNFIRHQLRPRDVLIVNGVLPEFICGLWGRLDEWSRLYYIRGAVGRSKLWNMMSFKGLDYVVFTTEAMKSQFFDIFPKFKKAVAIIPDFLPDMPVPSNRTFGETGIVLGCVGFIDPDKNQEMLLRVLKKIRDQNIDVHVKFYGISSGIKGDAYKVHLEEEILKNGLGEFVSFEGYKPKSVIYNSIDVLVSVSKSEGFGKTLIEAMSYGVPVIAFASAGGPANIIRNRINGLLISTHCDGLLEAAVIDLCNDANLRKIIIAGGFSDACEIYSPEAFLVAFRKCLQEMTTNIN